MQIKTGRIRQKNTDARRAELIQATLRVIAQHGVMAASVRSISKEANVTQGLIRYYFDSKDELIAAAYESYMADLVRSADEIARSEKTAVRRLANFIRFSLEPPITSHESVSVWAGFFETLLHNDRMTESHKRSYDSLRLHLKVLISEAFEEVGRTAKESELRRLSIAGNAIMDGLWMEGGALPEAFHEGELVQVGLECFSALLSIDLMEILCREDESELAGHRGQLN